MQELDEVITFFDNKVIICGSVCDLIYIKYTGKINDYDFIINETDFLNSLNLDKHQDEISNPYFRLKRSGLRTFGNIKYYGHYKNSKIDIFLNDASHVEKGIYIDISSKHFIDSSIFLYYKIQNKYTRWNKLLELRAYIETKFKSENEEEWKKIWRIVKKQQLEEKIPEYEKIL